MIAPLPAGLWPYTPSPRQLQMLLATNGSILYGGGAGGGKSSGLLMAASQYAGIAEYRGLVIRRTFADLDLPGAILDRARQWWRPLGIRYDAQQRRFTFPSGAVVQFGYLQDPGDEYRYQSSEYQQLFIDEAGQLRPPQMQYLASRLRRGHNSRVPIRQIYASNPGGPAHDWLHHQFVEPPEPDPHYRFIPSLMADNPGLNHAEYRAQLAQLDPVTRAQLEHGDWNVRITTGWFQVDNIHITNDIPDCQAYVRAWDFASTPGGGDYTVGLLLGKDADGTIYILDCCRGQWAPADRQKQVLRCAANDPTRTRIVLEQEPGSAGKDVQEHYTRLLSGYNIRFIPPTGSKQVRAEPLAAAIANRVISSRNAQWNDALLAELAAFPEGVHDDQVDAMSLGFRQVNQPAYVKPKVPGKGRLR